MRAVRGSSIRWARLLKTPRVVALCLLSSVAGCYTTAPRYALPPTAGEPVIILEHAEGEGQPLLRFTNDGKVLTRAGQAEIEIDRLQEILDYVLATERFFDIDSDAVKLAIHQQNSQRGSALAVFNAPTTAMELRLRDRTHRVEVHALEFQATTHANIQSLQRLIAIQRRLIRESGIAILGGEKKLRKITELASAALQEKYPDRADLTAEQLVGVGSRKSDGALVAHFRREESATILSYVVVVVPETGDATGQVIER